MKTLDGKTFASMVTNGYRALKKKYQEINDLNVFPVPDGDTGTNMASTINGGITAIERSKLEKIGDVAVEISNGMLLGARGNSGVIVSQFFAGIAEGLQGLTTANVAQFVSALRFGTKKAYDAVIKPVEGTILTVARESTEFVSNKISTIRTFETLFEVLKEQMAFALQRTPDLLPVLKEAGVIDSGGAGLLTIVDGMGKQILGEELDDIDFESPSNGAGASVDTAKLFNEDSVLEYGYCTEFILQLLNSKNGPQTFELQDLIDYFQTIGDSLVAIRSANIVKVHVHTKQPNLVMEYALKFGDFITWKLENMSIQHNEMVADEKPSEKKEFAIVAVAPSEQIGEYFTQLGVDYIVSGGQTMNPSANDFIEAFKACNAKKILVFPNNGNIVLTAKQAASMYNEAEMIVFECKSSINCYSALSAADFQNIDLETNIKAIRESLDNVITCEVCRAVRESVNNGISIKENDYMGICMGQMKSAKPDIIDCTMEMLSTIEGIDDKNTITVFYGADATDEIKERFEAAVSDSYPLIDLIEYEGSQIIYPFIIAVE